MYSKHRQKDGSVLRTCPRVLLLLLGLVLLLAPGLAAALQPEPPGGRTVTVRWISQGRTRRGVSTGVQESRPGRGELLLSSHRLQLVLQVHHNHDLLSPDFTETFFTDDGQQVTLSSSNHTDHCFYHGRVKGHPQSWTALSLCSGVRGLISLNSSHWFYLQPSGGADPLQHSLLDADLLTLRGGTCGHHHPHHHHHHENTLGEFSSMLTELQSRVKRSSGGTTKYLELYIVADNTLFKRQNRDYGKTKTRIMEIANYVDKQLESHSPAWRSMTLSSVSLWFQFIDTPVIL